MTAANNQSSIDRDAALDARIDTTNETVANNNQSSIDRDTALGGRIDDTNQTVTTEVGRLDAANQAQDVAFAKDQARQDAVTAANNQSSIDRDAALDGRIDNTNQTVADNKAAQAITDASQNTAINQNAADILTKADIDYVDSENVTQNTAISAIQNQSQQNAIKLNSKADISYVDAQNDAQNTVINTKVDRDAFLTDQARQDAITATKADKVEVDAKNKSQDALITQNKKGIESLKSADAVLEQQIKTSTATVNKRIDHNAKVQTIVDADQNRLIAENANRFAGLDQRVGSLDKTLSSGIASALAIGSMPTMSIAGAHMITGGSGHFNGQGSVAVGLTGTTDNGKISYKIGGSYTQDGGSAFSIGGGYRWK